MTKYEGKELKITIPDGLTETFANLADNYKDAIGAMSGAIVDSLKPGIDAFAEMAKQLGITTEEFGDLITETNSQEELAKGNITIPSGFTAPSIDVSSVDDPVAKSIPGVKEYQMGVGVKAQYGQYVGMVEGAEVDKNIVTNPETMNGIIGLVEDEYMESKTIQAVIDGKEVSLSFGMPEEIMDDSKINLEVSGVQMQGTAKWNDKPSPPLESIQGLPGTGSWVDEVKIKPMSEIEKKELLPLPQFVPTNHASEVIYKGVVKGVLGEDWPLGQVLHGTSVKLEAWQKKWSRWVSLGKQHYTSDMYVKLSAKHSPEKAGFMLRAVWKWQPKVTFNSFVPHETMLKYDIGTDDHLLTALWREWFIHGHFSTSWKKPTLMSGQAGKDGWLVNWFPTIDAWRLRKKGDIAFPFIDMPAQEVTDVGKNLIANRDVGREDAGFPNLFDVFKGVLDKWQLVNAPDPSRFGLIEL